MAPGVTVLPPTCPQVRKTETGDLREDVLSSSFARAMKLAHGTVVLLDASAACLSRSWVTFEVHLALSGALCGEAKREHKFDIYTPATATYVTGRAAEWHLACTPCVAPCLRPDCTLLAP